MEDVVILSTSEGTFIEKPLKLIAVNMGNMAVSESITTFLNNLWEDCQPLVDAGSCTFLWCEKIYLALVLYSRVMEREKAFEAAVSSVILYESVGWLQVPLTSFESLYCTTVYVAGVTTLRRVRSSTPELFVRGRSLITSIDKVVFLPASVRVFVGFVNRITQKVLRIL